jgi:hypothetical protein
VAGKSARCKRRRYSHTSLPLDGCSLAVGAPPAPGPGRCVGALDAFQPWRRPTITTFRQLYKIFISTSTSSLFDLGYDGG